MLTWFRPVVVFVDSKPSTPYASVMRGHSAALSGKRPQTADSASGSFARHIVLMFLQETCAEPVEASRPCR